MRRVKVALIQWNSGQTQARLECPLSANSGHRHLFYHLVSKQLHRVGDREPGKFLLIYFGFTHCPDVCPTDLQAIGLALDQLGKAAEEVQPLFITVDPERDTAQLLADYLPSFHPRLIGLSGDAASIRQAARAYKVYYAKVPTADGSDYTVDHSGYIYLMDRAGQYLGFFPPGTPPDRMADCRSRKL